MLKDKIALVTGGSRGIGKAVALKYEKLGAKVIICSRTIDSSFLSQIKNMNIEYYKCDLRKNNEIKKMIKYIIKKYKKIDILANIAGISPKKKNGMKILFDELNRKDWDDVINTNLSSVFVICEEVVKYMKKQKYGRIINMSSIVGLTNSEHGPASAAYVVSKTGLIGLTKAMAYDLGKYNITVNAVAGGRINTNMSKKNNNYYNKLHKKLIPMHRFGSPEEVANAFVFYAEEENSYITGDVMNLTGGWFL